MLFGLRTRVGPGSHVLDAGPDPPWEGEIWTRETLSAREITEMTGKIKINNCSTTDSEFGETLH